MLSSEKRGEIALRTLRNRIEKDGLHVRIPTTKGDICRMAKELDIAPAEAAEFYEMGIDFLFTEVKKIIDEIKKG